MQQNELNNVKIFYYGISSEFSIKLAEKLLQTGAILFITDANAMALEAFRKKYETFNGNSHFHRLLEDTPSQIEGSIVECFNKTKSFTCAINNFLIPDAKLNILDCSIDYWNSIFRTKMARFYTFIKYELSLMIGLRKGCLINTFNYPEMKIENDSHIVFAFLNSIIGLTESVGRTYSGAGIKISSYYPAIENLLNTETKFNSSIATAGINNDAGSFAPVFESIIKKIKESELQDN
jgi:NAD(P)-dependent dehydrogenase (short-subunit alcohol dehydrogenase family)